MELNDVAKECPEATYEAAVAGLRPDQRHRDAVLPPRRLLRPHLFTGIVIQPKPAGLRCQWTILPPPEIPIPRVPSGRPITINRNGFQLPRA